MVLERSSGSDTSWQEVTKGQTSTSLSATASVTALGAGYKREFPLRENGQNIRSAASREAASGAAEIKESKVMEQLKPGLKLGANVSMEMSGKRTSAVLANTVRDVQEATQRIAQQVNHVVGCATAGSSNGCVR